MPLPNAVTGMTREKTRAMMRFRTPRMSAPKLADFSGMYPRRSYGLVLLGSRWVKRVREGQRGFHLMLRVMRCSRDCSKGIDQSRQRPRLRRPMYVHSGPGAGRYPTASPVMRKPAEPFCRGLVIRRADREYEERHAYGCSLAPGVRPTPAGLRPWNGEALSLMAGPGFGRPSAAMGTTACVQTY
jgi:hypothetical protein